MQYRAIVTVEYYMEVVRYIPFIFYLLFCPVNSAVLYVGPSVR